MPINKVFELGRRAVRKELVALRGKDGGDEGEEGGRGIIIPKDWFVEFQRKWVEGKSRRRWFIQKDVIRTKFGYTEVI